MIDPVPRVAAGSTLRRRHLTILFSDLCGSTRLASAMEAEHYADVLAALRDVYVSVVPRHGGTVIRIQGDGILAIFGHPEARENDGRRATEAALDLHARVGALRFDPPLPGGAALDLHTGIHAGLVLLDEGDLVRGRFDLVGDAPNVAARLSDAADRGEILVSAGTLGPESHFFQTSELRRLSLRGRSEPVAAVRILARAPIGTRFEARSQRGLAPFVGRRAELRTLERHLDAVLAGAPGRLTLRAPAGQGKTRLVQEFLRRAAMLDCEIHRGYCESYLSAEPLQPLLQMLRHLFGLQHGMASTTAADAVRRTLARIDPALDEHQDELLRLLSIGDASEAARRRANARATLAAFRDLFDRLAGRRPLVLFIDDWQWADAATRAVVDAVTGLEQRPVFVLTAVRGGPAGAAMAGERTDANAATPLAAVEAPVATVAPGAVLELGPFSDDEAAEAIARLLPHLDPFVLADIRRYAGGNPLFLEELCHSAAHDGERRLGRALGSTAWLHALIESRVARLPERQAELVRTAAVIGNVVPTWLLESLTGFGADHPLVRGLADQDIVFPGEKAGTLRFKHGVARDVIYDAVGLHPRRALHRRIAEALREQGSLGAQDDVLEALAYHYAAAGMADPAAHYAELAGDKARAASALDRAQAQYRAALTALDQLPAAGAASAARWIAIAERFALVCVFDPSSGQLAVLRRAVERAAAHGDPAALARAQHWLGYVHYALGDAREAIHHGERALAAAAALGEGPMPVQITATLGQARAAAGDYAAALPLLDAAVAVKQSHRSGARPAVGLSYTLACKAAVLGDQGRFADAQDCFDEALAVVRGSGHEVESSVLGWRCAVFLWQGRWEEAQASADESCQVAVRVKSRFLQASGQALGAYAAWALERKPTSLRTLVDATEWLEARDRRLAISMNHAWIADILVESEDFAGLRRPAGKALSRARAGDRLGEAMTYRTLARAAAHRSVGRSPDCYVTLALAASAARGSRHEVAVTQWCGACIAAARGHRSRALALLDQAEAGFDAMQMAWHLHEVEALRRRL